MKRIKRFNEAKVTKSDRIIEEVKLICQDFVDNGFRLKFPISKNSYIGFKLYPKSILDSEEGCIDSFRRGYDVNFVLKEDFVFEYLENGIDNFKIVEDLLPELRDRLADLGCDKININKELEIEFHIRVNKKMPFL